MKPTNAPQSLKMTKVMLMIVLFMVFLGSVESFSSYMFYNNESCYQETANLTHTTDTSCLLNYSGTYGISNSYYALINMMDGDWTTFYNTISGDAFSFYVNYTKPNSKEIFNITSAIWRFKDSVGETNTKINTSCFNFNENNIQLQFNVTHLITSQRIDLFCFNGTWNPIKLNNNHDENPYEEAIFWETAYNYPTGNITYLSSSSKLRYLSIPNNTFITNARINLSGFTNYGINITKLNVSINNIEIYYYPINFTQLNNRTNNFYKILNQYLSSCSIVNGYCNVPIAFSSNSAGILSYSDLLFNNFGFIQNNLSYNTSVSELSSNNFNINLTYDSEYYTSINANLIYNNTQYSATKSGNGNTIIFSSSAISPNINTNTNIPFYWTIQLNNGTNTEYYNSTEQNQSVLPVNIGVCNATFTKVIVNFSNFDETTRARLLSPTNNNTYNVDLRLGSPSLNEYTYISVNSTSNSLAICFNETIVSPLRLDYVVQYTSSGHTSEYYYIQNFTLTNQTLYNNVSLYPLLTTSSQEFLIKVKNENFLSITGAVVEIYRKYVELGQYVLVEAPITDSLGQTIGHLVKNDVIYTIVVKKNGQTLNTYNDIQVYCNTLTQECILNLNPYGTSTQPSSFIDYRGVSYTARYDDSTQLYEVEFTSTNGSSRNMSIYAWILDNTQNVSVCSNIVSGVTGTLSCSLSTAEGKTALINVYVDGNLLFSDYVRVGFEKNDIMDNIRYILLAFLIPFFVMFALSSGSLAIIFYILGIIFGIGIYALDTQSFIGAGSFLIWFIVAGIILIIKIMRGGVKNG